MRLFGRPKIKNMMQKHKEMKKEKRIALEYR